MWLSLIWFILVLFVCWNLFCTIVNLRIKCVTETKNVSVLFYKILKSSFLYDSHIWFWGFFTLLVALAHGVPLGLRYIKFLYFKRFRQRRSTCGSRPEEQGLWVRWLLKIILLWRKNIWNVFSSEHLTIILLGAFNTVEECETESLQKY